MDEAEDLNELIRELNEGRPSARAGAADSSPDSVRLDRWLQELTARSGSDLLLVAGSPPSVRLDGAMHSLSEPPLSGDEIEEAVLPALAPHARARYRESGIADASHRVRGLGRFRVNLHRERGRAAAAVRALPAHPPRLSALGLPAGVEGLTRLARGLVLIGGPTGSGKTTTLAALVVGEMRDPETMRIALAAAETGHLVFSTVHTTDAASTVSRIADSFPPERQNTIRQELSMALAALLTQTLLPRKSGGRAAAAELLFASYGARQHIRKNALQHLHQEIAITKKQGSVTLEESLARLAREGVVDVEEARARAAHPEEFENYLRGA